jgi:hypothetical protein
MTQNEALRLALEALEKLFGIPDKWTGEGEGDVAVWRLGGSYRAQQAITAIKAALEAKDEPVAWIKRSAKGNIYDLLSEPDDGYEPVYTTPPQQEAKDEPVAWDGYNLDDMCEAFNRVIEEHFHRKHPFHDPVNNDAMIALRTFRGFIPYMKRHTTPPQRTWVGLKDDDEIDWDGDDLKSFVKAIEAKLKEKNT